MKRYLLYIDGKWVRSSSRKTFESRSPFNKILIGTCEEGNSDDVGKAVDAAVKAFPSWRDTPAPKRALILQKIAQILREKKKQLGRLVSLEMGKQLKEGLGDVQEAIDIYEYMAGEGRRLFGHTTTSELPKKFSMTVRQPVGPFGIITPWNFPIAIPAWKLSAALICGNTVVFKPASDTPVCALELVKIHIQAGLPAGVLNVVTGSGSAVGTPIVENPRLRGISFTGSSEVGRQVLKDAGVKKIGLELGGKNPIIVMEDANLDLAVDGCVWGAFGTTGQRCTAASRIIIHRKVLDKFLRKFIGATKKLRVGDPLKCDVGPVVNKSQLEKIDNYVKLGIREGAKLILGGKILKEGKLKNGFFYAPTIFTNCTQFMTICQDEIFGPVVSIIPVDSFEQAIEAANSVKYGLSSAIYTRNINRAFEAIDKIEAGLTYINSSTIGSEAHLPFGGVKATGIGTKEAGILGIDEFSELKTVYVDYSGKLQKAQIED